ncbi:Uma2 family endonuclease [Sphingomonas profundi]|uniref:Uma2 family endonuclease n=1 Tax=Alterirhizorhabdus profundi TaxID=2681549 RepID=UPI0012E8BF94|nr:Uma2 family endonuclease [Sphingomonas profundi]
MTEFMRSSTGHLSVKLRIDEYLMLDVADTFATSGKTELLDGEVRFIDPQHRPHARMKSRLYRLLADAMDGSAHGIEALVGASVAMSPHDAPEPDIVLTDAADGEGLIPVRAVALVVEVADTTLASDLGAKAGLYAAAAIREYWVVDVNARVIHQLWAPVDGRYTDRDTVRVGERVASRTIAGLRLDTETL